MPRATITREISLRVDEGLFDGDGGEVNGHIGVVVEEVELARGGTEHVVVVRLFGTPRDDSPEGEGHAPVAPHYRSRAWTEEDYGIGGWPLMDPDDLRIAIPIDALRELVADL